MHTKHLSPYYATQEVMHEISGAIIAITLVMTAVFIPVTFIQDLWSLLSAVRIDHGYVHRFVRHRGSNADSGSVRHHPQPLNPCKHSLNPLTIFLRLWTAAS